MIKSEQTEAYFAAGYNCAQAVFTPFGIEMGLTEDQCMKIAGTFGGGMARQQLTCGAVTGALMVIGLYFGGGIDDYRSKKEATYSMANKFFDEFRKRNNALSCRELLQGLDMNDPEDLKKIQELGLFGKSCVTYVRDAVEIIDALILLK
jgi:C_GCAxxG_C_C family probable redox protein